MDIWLTILMALCTIFGLGLGILLSLSWAELRRRQDATWYESQINEAINIGFAWKEEAIKRGYNQG